MKLIALMVGVLSASLTFAQVIVKDGQSTTAIVLAARPLPANDRAAHELQTYIAEISGATLPIRSDADPLPERAILIGPSRHLDALGIKLDQGKLGNDGFVLKSMGDHLIIAGPGPRGSMYGTYEVLERLGVRWFTPKITRVPRNKTIEFPAPLDETQVPAFEYREPFFTEAQEKDWAAHNRVVGSAAHLDASTGGTIKYADFVHTLDHLVPPALYKDHPEYFPMVKGTRIDGNVQRCLSSPDVLRLSIEGVKKAFKDHPECVMTSVSQNDARKWCECDTCNKLAQQYGGQSGVYIWFVNQVAEAIEKDPACADKLIDTLAYQFTEAPPTNIVPRKNVRVRLCPISVCQAHAYERDDFPASKAFISNLADWAKITDKLYIWHYTTNFAHYLQPFPDFNEFPADLRLYQKSGVRGVFFEGDYAPGGGGSDAELRSWVMAKLLWNPSADSDKLVTQWMQGVYGPAARPMRQWFDLLHERAADPKNHFDCYAPPASGVFDGDVIPRGDAFFDAAGTLAAGDATAKEFVNKSRLWLRYLKIARNVGGEDVAKFVADCKSWGITHISETKTLEAWSKR